MPLALPRTTERPEPVPLFREVGLRGCRVALAQHQVVAVGRRRRLGAEHGRADRHAHTAGGHAAQGPECPTTRDQSRASDPSPGPCSGEPSD